MKVTRFKCVVCGKVTSGRLPAGYRLRHVADGSFRYPRRHRSLQGSTCPGVFEEAEWVDVEM